jgi:outer membrane receptor protein involved in Fe transport
VLISSNRRLALLLATTCCPGIAMAQTSKPAAAEERASDAIIVTGKLEKQTQVAAEAVEYGNAVQIVTADAIAASGSSNFAELAQFLIKGVNVGYSPDEGEYTIRLDGGGDRDTLVVLDNVPLYDRGPALETIWPATTIDPHMIERVEVFRGGNSLFFGSNGGIGVVNIVTKKPDGTQKFEIGASYGSFNSRELWGNASFPLDSEGRFSVMVYGGSQQTDGPRIYDPAAYVDNVAAGGGVQKFPLNRTNVGLKFLWNVDDKTEFRLNGQYTEIIFQDAFPDTNTFSPNRVRYPIVDLSIDRKWSENARTEFGFYWTNPLLNNTETQPDICRIRTGCVDPANAARIIPWGRWTGRNTPFVNQGFGPDSKVGGFQEFGYNLRQTLNFPGIIELVGGVQIVKYQDDSDAVFRLADDATTVTGLYLDVRPVIPFSPTTKISGAIRQDFISGGTKETIWKFGFRQPIGPFYLRANGGTSYSAPLTNERFQQLPVLGTSNRGRYVCPIPAGVNPILANVPGTCGNPDLQTERTETYNVAAGFEKNFGGVALSGEVGYFRTNIKNRIRTTTGGLVTVPVVNALGVLVPTGATQNTFFNDPDVTEIRGFTADFDMRIGETASFGIGFTKQQARPKGNPFQINETPEYFLQGRASYNSPDKRFHVNLFGRYQGPEWQTGGPTRTVANPGPNDTYFLNGVLTPIPANIPTARFRQNFGNYFVLNGSIAYWAGDKQQHKFQLRVVNIFDKLYAERYGFGNQSRSEAFITERIVLNSDQYFYGYRFEGKPRSVFLSYSTTF